MSKPPVPVWTYDPEQAELAFEAFAELRKLVCARPELADNPYFTALQDTAKARFLARYEPSV